LLTTDNIETDVTRTILAIRPNVLRAGDTYTFRYTVTDPINGAGSSEVTIEINEAPLLGIFDVTPNDGIAYETFEFSCTQFSDEDGPLKYVFGYFDEINNVFVQLTARPTMENSYHTSSIPAGTGPNSTMLFVVNVIDSLGAITQATKRVTVREYQVESAADFDAFTSKASSNLDSAVESGDVESIANLGTSLSDMFNKMSAKARRIRSSDTDVDAAGTVIREKIIGALNNAVNKDQTPSSAESVNQVASALNAITNNPLQISNTTLSTAEIFISNTTDKLSDSFSLEASSSLGNAVSNLIQNLQVQVSAVSGEIPGVEFPDMNGPRRVHESTPTSKTSLTAILAKSLENQKKLIENLGFKMLKNTLPGLEAQKLKTPSFSSFIFKEDPSKLSDKQISIDGVSQALSSQVLLPASFSKTDNTETFGSQPVGIKINVQSNPYIDNSASQNIASPVLTIKFATDDESVLDVKDLRDAIKMILPVPQGVNVSAIRVNETLGGFVPMCRYWDTKNNTWSSAGCKMTNYTKSSISCECTHTTDYSSFLEYITPQLNILHAQDFRNITKLNKDNMLALVFMCILLFLYVVLMTIFFAARLFVSHRKRSKVSETTETKQEKHEPSGPLRKIWHELKSENVYLALIVGSEHDNFPRTQKLTVIYIAILGILTGNALTFGSNEQNETQFAIGWIVSELVSYPFIMFFTVVFLSTAPFQWKQRRTLNVPVIEEIEQPSRVHPEDETISHDVVTEYSDNSLAVIEDDGIVVYYLKNEVSPRTSTPRVPTPSPRSGVRGDSASSMRDVVSCNNLSLSENTERADTCITDLESQMDKTFVTRIMDRFDGVVDFIDKFILGAQDLIDQFMEKITWQGMIFILLIFLLYCGAVTGICFVLPKAFQWFHSDHQIALAVVALLAFFVFMETIYIRIRYQKFKSGDVLSWRLTYLAIAVAVGALVMAILVGVSLIPVIILHLQRVPGSLN
jgi:hypothetical protein